jgi:hypothetical protein
MIEFFKETAASMASFDDELKAYTSRVCCDACHRDNAIDAAAAAQV